MSFCTSCGPIPNCEISPAHFVELNYCRTCRRDNLYFDSLMPFTSLPFFTRAFTLKFSSKAVRDNKVFLMLLSSNCPVGHREKVNHPFRESSLCLLLSSCFSPPRFPVSQITTLERRALLRLAGVRRGRGSFPASFLLIRFTPPSSSPFLVLPRPPPPAFSVGVHLP